MIWIYNLSCRGFTWEVKSLDHTSSQQKSLLLTKYMNMTPTPQHTHPKVCLLTVKCTNKCCEILVLSHQMYYSFKEGICQSQTNHPMFGDCGWNPQPQPSNVFYSPKNMKMYSAMERIWGSKRKTLWKRQEKTLQL